jgi:hypothetical protein
MTDNKNQEMDMKTPDQPDFHWSLGLKTHIQAGSSEASSNDGAKSLTTEEKMPDVKTEKVHLPVRSTTPLSMKWVEYVSFIGYAHQCDRNIQRYFCDECFLLGLSKQYGGVTESDKERILEDSIYHGSLTLEEFRNRWLSLDDEDNICYNCKTRLCYLELIETK